MSRIDYVALAGAIIKARLMHGPREDFDTAHTALDVAAQTVADVCASGNPRFDRARFLAAAGVGGGVVSCTCLGCVYGSWTMDRIKVHDAGAGGYWFERDTMRFFDSRVSDTVYQGPGGIFFVSSERFVDSRGTKAPRLYSVRQFRPYAEGGTSIDTVGEFQDYTTRKQAQGAAKRAAEGR